MKSKLFVLGIVILLLVGCATEKSSWEKAKKENTIAAYENFKKNYPHSSVRWEATARVAFLRAAEKNTIEAYKKFLKHHYMLKDLADQARAGIENIYFEEAGKQGSISSYEKFLKQYPHGIFSGKANIELERPSSHSTVN